MATTTAISSASVIPEAIAARLSPLVFVTQGRIIAATQLQDHMMEKQHTNNTAGVTASNDDQELP